ncbi:MAG: helix-turn-helix transcriptional regulator [Syntrophomonas sp.]|nr:helix-turn-helix transcriptional regulator [Syntrophomonas sp.]
MQEENSLTPVEVAGILKIAKNTVYELIKRGELPAYRIGRKLRVDPKDVDIFRKQGKNFEFFQKDNPVQVMELRPPVPTFADKESDFHAPGLIICGQDIILDILARHLESSINKLQTFRYNVGSFTGLSTLYQGKADMVGIHLWDGDTGEYNISYVRHLLPSIPTVIIHLAIRMQGFYVLRGNPKNIQEWQDLIRPGIRFINREKGCGTRVLLDEQLRRLKLSSQAINGYKREEHSHLAVASAVVRGEADVALGNEKASLQVRGVDFIPLQKERYELVIKKESMEKPQFQAVMEILQSREFKAELQGLGDYDLTETGRIIAEL